MTRPIPAGIRLRVTVPATSANLGPGFDCLGVALELRDELSVAVLEPGEATRIEVRGEGAGTIPLDESHLILKTLRYALAEAGLPEEAQPALELVCLNRIPHARGLGSSAAAVVAGIAAADGLLRESGGPGLGDGERLAIADRIEGHPDNAAPALFGGAAIGWRDGRSGAPGTVRIPVHPELRFVLAIPETRLSTAHARELLPAAVAHAAAAANSARVALLVHALGSDPGLLMTATEDRLHQEFRRPAMPGSLALLDALRADGVAAVISGAGPAVLAFAAGDSGQAAASASVLASGFSGEVRTLRLAEAGATVTIG